MNIIRHLENVPKVLLIKIINMQQLRSFIYNNYTKLFQILYSRSVQCLFYWNFVLTISNDIIAKPVKYQLILPIQQFFRISFKLIYNLIMWVFMNIHATSNFIFSFFRKFYYSEIISFSKNILTFFKIFHKRTI